MSTRNIEPGAGNHRGAETAERAAEKAAGLLAQHWKEEGKKKNAPEGVKYSLRTSFANELQE